MDDKKPGVTPLMELGKKSLRIGNQYIREAIGEFFGTLIVGFMCVGAGGHFMVITKGNGVESSPVIILILGITLGIMTAIVITGGVSGGHVNPAVSIGLAVAGELSWYSVPGYVISQFLGAIVGALLGWSLIHPTIRQAFDVANTMSIPEFDMYYNKSQLVSVFSPIKSPGCTVSNGLATELVLTCLLIMAICGLVDKQSAIKPPGYLLPIVIPLVIASFCFAHGLPTGSLLNPARDVGPRIAAWILGWTPESIFMSTDWDGNVQHWWVVGLFGPILGGILGGFIYSFIIGPQVNLEHLQVAERQAIRQVIAANTDDNGGGNWRGSNSTTTTSISAFIPRPQPPVTNNVGPYTSSSSYSTNNNIIITDAYPTQQRSPFQGSLYPSQGYPNKGAVNTNGGFGSKIYGGE